MMLVEMDVYDINYIRWIAERRQILEINSKHAIYVVQV